MSDNQFEVTPDMDITTFYKTISAKGKVAMAEKRAKGEVMHKAPLGYKNARDEEGRSILEIDPETQEISNLILSLYKNGRSNREIAQDVLLKKRLSHMTVSRVIKRSLLQSDQLLQ